VKTVTSRILTLAAASGSKLSIVASVLMGHEGVGLLLAAGSLMMAIGAMAIMKASKITDACINSALDEERKDQ